MRNNNSLAVLLAFAIPFAGHAQDEKVDLTMMHKIRKEGLENSKVMEIAFNLTDKSGNRLTASPGFMRAANYAKETLAGWGSPMPPSFPEVNLVKAGNWKKVRSLA